MESKNFWHNYYRENMQSISSPGAPGRWDNWAEKYNGFASLSGHFTDIQIECLKIDKADSVIDLGCGPGRLTVPLAGMAGRVTALDGSARMLDFARMNAGSAGLKNLEYIRMAWNDVEPGRNVELHDVVLASRSPAFNDINKMDKLAIKRGYILTFDKSSLKHFHDELTEGIFDNRMPPRKERLPFHMIVFNLLCEKGYCPEVRFVEDGFRKLYPSREDAYNDFSWLGIPEEKTGLFRTNLDRFLSETEDGSIRLLKKTRTVIISWDKGIRAD